MCYNCSQAGSEVRGGNESKLLDISDRLGVNQDNQAGVWGPVDQ